LGRCRLLKVAITFLVAISDIVVRVSWIVDPINGNSTSLPIAAKLGPFISHHFNASISTDSSMISSLLSSLDDGISNVTYVLRGK
jgi:hypothetical protein